MAIGGRDILSRKEGVGKQGKHLFYFGRRRRDSPAPPPAFPICPSGAPLPTPAHPDGLHSTGSRANHARCKADHATHRHTRPDAGHAAPVCTRYQTGRAGTIGQCAGRWTACATCPIGHAQTGKKIKTYKYVIMLRVQLDKNVNIRYNISTT